MSLEERILKRIKKEPALFFITDFLTSFEQAEIYLVGGAVRDILLGRSMPELDFDFVIRGVDTESLQAWLDQRGDVDLVGRDFGVFKFMPQGFGTSYIEFIDIALPRTEASAPDSVGGYKEFDIQSDPHLPIEDDLSRRDFSMNAMAFDIGNQRLIDPFNGAQDIESRVIDTVGDPDERFSEDMSRMLRAIRFAAELNFNIEPRVLASIRKKAEEINRVRKLDTKDEYVVPREVLGLELAKAFDRNPAGAVQWLEKSGLLHALIPDIQRIADVDTNYLTPLTQTDREPVSVIVALLLRALSQEQIRETITFTGLSTLPKHSTKRVDVDQQLWVNQKLHPPMSKEDVLHMPAAQFERWFFNGKGSVLMDVMKLLGHGDVVTAIVHRREAIETRWAVERGEKIPPLLSGDDVISAGVPQGPRVRTLLDDCRSAQLEGDLMRREEALAWLKERV